MAVPLFDTSSTLAPLDAEIRAKVSTVLDRGVFVLGEEVRAFEAELAAYVGAPHAIGVANGTDAIVLALRALGIGPGDDVVVPSFTFYASAEAIALTGPRPGFWDAAPRPVRPPLAGARPVFCDVGPRTFCLTVDSVRAALTPQTRAALSVHLFGNVAPVAEIEALAVPGA